MQLVILLHLAICTSLTKHRYVATVPLDLNFTYARVQKATARKIHGNALE